jgi:hypothetical protein
LSWWKKGVLLSSPVNLAIGATAVAMAGTADTVVAAASVFDQASADRLYFRHLAATTHHNSEVRMAHERRIEQAVTESWDPGPFPTYFRTFRKGKVYFEVSFSELTRKSQYGIHISPGKYTYANRRKQGSLEIDLDMSSDADEFLQLLRSLKIEVESSWKTHALSFSNIDPGLKIAIPEELLSSAAEQEYKWGTYLRACLD